MAKKTMRKKKRGISRSQRVAAALHELVAAGSNILVLSAFASLAQQQRWLKAQRAASELLR